MIEVTCIGLSIKCNNGYLICLNWCFQWFMCTNYMICKETLTERKTEQRYICTMRYSGSQLRAWLSPGLQYSQPIQPKSVEIVYGLEYA